MTNHSIHGFCGTINEISNSISIMSDGSKNNNHRIFIVPTVDFMNLNNFICSIIVRAKELASKLIALLLNEIQKKSILKMDCNMPERYAHDFTYPETMNLTNPRKLDWH